MLYLIYLYIYQLYYTQTQKANNLYCSCTELIRLNDLRTQGAIRQQKQLSFLDRREPSIMNSDSLASTLPTLWQQFYLSLKPYDESEWDRANLPTKGLIILRMPILVILKIFIPITDQEEEGHGWSRLLNCAQMVLLPSLICYATRKWSINLRLAWM